MYSLKSTSQPVTKEELERLIKEGKAAGKDVRKLKSALKKGDYCHSKTSPFGKKKKRGRTITESTGPIKKGDFKRISK